MLDECRCTKTEKRLTCVGGGGGGGGGNVKKAGPLID